MIDRETVDRIYAAANIVDIIGEYVTLKRKGGNVVTFLMEHESLTYPDALKMVAKRYGIEVKD